LKTVRATVILAGTLALILGLRTFGRSYSMTRWPIIPGRILSSGVVAEKGGRPQARIEYEFILAGRVHRGVLPEPLPTREAAESFAALYPPGREIAVGYDPGDPAQSVLRPHIRWWSLAVAVTGAILVAAGIWPRKT
jgi:hypothetical protein